MAEKTYIDKNLLIQTIAFHEIEKDIDASIDSCGSEYITMIDNQPAADVVAVVKCKDCKYLLMDLSTMSCHLCMNEKDYVVRHKVALNDYCSYGVRKGQKNG